MRTRARRPAAGFLATVLAMVALLAPAAPAAAHNTLRAATPAQDAQLTTAPKEITLQFGQRLNPTFTTIVLSDGGQRRVPTGEPVINGTTGTVTIGEALANGTYTVAYRVVSADGHPVQGSYQFTVADPAGAPAAPTATGDPAATESAATATATASRDGGDGLPVAVLAVGAVVIVAAGIGAVVLLRRRRPTS